MYICFFLDFIQAVGILGFGGIGDFAARQLFRQLGIFMKNTSYILLLYLLYNSIRKDANRNGVLDFNEAIKALQLVQNLYSQQFGGSQGHGY